MTERRHAARTTALAGALVIALSACSGTAAVEEPGGTVFDPSTIHAFDVEIDEAAYQAMVQTYLDTGDKEWISGTVTIDGQVFDDVGLKLKGNSSLRGVGADTAPETLPWRIELDEFVQGQSLDGYSDFVVRANTTQTALNEAVALDLLEAAGLASEHAVSASFTVNGSEADLRLVLQNLDGDWDEENFGGEGILYKADADGDYSYRGEDPTAYAQAFDVDAGEEDYAPLMEFLDFVNNSTDSEFSQDLASYLEVESFARYLAFEDLVGNFDDIAGPGNNSYLRWDPDTGLMTVVAWDHNLAFGAIAGGPGGQQGGVRGGGPGFPPGGGPGGFPGGQPPEGFEPPTDGQGGGLQPGGGGMGGNVLAERFQADEGFAAMYDAALADLQAELVDSGVAQQVLAGWVELLTEQGTGLVDAGTIESEAAQVESVLSGEVVPQQFTGRPAEEPAEQPADAPGTTSAAAP